MTYLRHRRLSGAGLCFFAVFEFAVLVNTGIMARRVYLDLPEDTIRSIFLVSVSIGLLLALVMIAIQMTAGWKLLSAKYSNPKLTIAGCIIAILTLWGLPVGIYAMWTQLHFQSQIAE